MSINRASIYLAALALALAMAFFNSPETRLSADAYWAVNATGGGRVWGTLFMVTGLMLTIFSIKSLPHLRTSFIIASVPYFLLCGAFIASAAKFDTANLTAPVVYAWIAIVHLRMARTTRNMYLGLWPPRSKGNEQTVV